MSIRMKAIIDYDWQDKTRILIYKKTGKPVLLGDSTEYGTINGGRAPRNLNCEGEVWCGTAQFPTNKIDADWIEVWEGI